MKTTQESRKRAESGEERTRDGGIMGKWRTGTCESPRGQAEQSRGWDQSKIEYGRKPSTKRKQRQGGNKTAIKMKLLDVVLSFHVFKSSSTVNQIRFVTLEKRGSIEQRGRRSSPFGR
jgi:hypothetical protein